MTNRGRAATASSAAWNPAPMIAASSGPPNWEMSAPAAKSRSPPVITTAPGGSAASSSAAAPISASSSPRECVHLAVAQGRDGDAVVASFQRQQFEVGHRRSLANPTAASSHLESATAVDGPASALVRPTRDGGRTVRRDESTWHAGVASRSRGIDAPSQRQTTAEPRFGGRGRRGRSRGRRRLADLDGPQPALAR